MSHFYLGPFRQRIQVGGGATETPSLVLDVYDVFWYWGGKKSSKGTSFGIIAFADSDSDSDCIA